MKCQFRWWHMNNDIQKLGKKPKNFFAKQLRTITESDFWNIYGSNGNAIVSICRIFPVFFCADRPTKRKMVTPQLQAARNANTYNPFSVNFSLVQHRPIFECNTMHGGRGNEQRIRLYFYNARHDAWDKVNFSHFLFVVRLVFDDERQPSGAFRFMLRWSGERERESPAAKQHRASHNNTERNCLENIIRCIVLVIIIIIVVVTIFIRLILRCYNDVVIASKWTRLIRMLCKLHTYAWEM